MWTWNTGITHKLKSKRTYIPNRTKRTKSYTKIKLVIKTWIATNAVVTCEINIFRNYFSLRRRLTDGTISQHHTIEGHVP